MRPACNLQYEVDLLTRVAFHIRIDDLSFTCLGAPPHIRPREYLVEDLPNLPPEGCDILIGGLGLTTTLLALDQEAEDRYFVTDQATTSVFRYAWRHMGLVL